MVSFLKSRIMILLFYLFRIFPIKVNKVVFSNFSGKGYGDNAKYIAIELLRQGDENYDLVWLCNEGIDLFPANIRAVRRLSLKSIYEQCTAKVWIDNRRKPLYVRKRKGQFYIQTWHGMTAIKKVEKDVEKVMPKQYIAAAKRDSEMADLFLAASNFDVKLFRQSFWYNGEILKCGYPRHDILFKSDKKLKLEVRKRLGIEAGTKVVMYAPTFRVKEDGSELTLYDIGWEQLLAALRERFDGEWIGIERLHPNIARFASKLKEAGNVINATDYPDMQELLLISDCIITDYSSSIIEYAMTGKVGFIFAADIADYIKDRGFYFTFDNLPFSVSKSKAELVANVISFDEEKYKKENREFYCKQYGLFEGGFASRTVAERIREVVSE